ARLLPHVPDHQRLYVLLSIRRHSLGGVVVDSLQRSNPACLGLLAGTGTSLRHSSRASVTAGDRVRAESAFPTTPALRPQRVSKLPLAGLPLRTCRRSFIG